MDRLSGLDSMFLALDGPTCPMHVGQVSIFDPASSPRGHSFERVRDTIAERLPLIAPFRRRLAPSPLPSAGHWVEDRPVDLDRHVRHLVLDRTADPHDLAAVASKILARPLDRDRPLWEIWVVENLVDDHVATVAKVHHAAVDGVAGVEVMANLLDLETDPASVPTQGGESVTSSAAARAVDGVRELLRRPLDVARLTGATARGVRELWRTARAEGLPPTPFQAPRTCLNGPISERRRLAFATVPMGELREVKEAFGVTLNDVVLAVVAGSLRSWLRDQDVCPETPLTALMPVSMRPPDDGGFGNRVTVALTSLATHVDDPVERLVHVVRSARRAKAQTTAIGEVLARWPDVIPSSLVGRASNLYSGLRMAQLHRPPFNVVISNVPGPDVPLYSAGARMRANYPVGPIYEGVGLNITTMSYCDRMYFGLFACPDVVSDVWSLADGITDACRSLQKAVA